MPFFFANPDQIPSRKKKGGRNGVTGYIRTAPSSLFIFTGGVIQSIGYAMGLLHLHLLYARIASSLTTNAYAILPMVDVKKVAVVISYTSSIPLRLPPVFISVFRRGVSDQDQTAINGMSMTEFTYGPNTTISYSKNRPTLADIATLDGLDSLSEEDAPKPYISIQNYGAYINLLGKVTQIGQAIYNLNHLGAHAITLGIAGGFSTAVEQEYHQVSLNTMPGGIGDIDADILVSEEKVQTTQYNVSGKIPNVGYSASQAFTTKIWGTSVEGKANVTGHTGGILIPWEVDFSNPDLGIIFQFVQLFSAFFSNEELNEITAAWREEIHIAEEGQWLAHIMKSLVLARDGQFAPYFLVRSNGNYDGCILFNGAGSLTTASSGKTSAMSLTDLHADIDAYNFHSSVLAKIITQFHLTVPAAGFTSMRELRAAIMPGNTQPSGADMNQLQKWLPHLTFEQVPLSGNVSDFEIIIPLLTSSTAVIPNTLFLHFDDFFTLDRTRLILSAFGNMVPDFELGSAKIKVSPTVSSSISKNVQDPYLPAGPNMLQMKRKSMATALSHWKYMMENGAVALKMDQKVAGGRTYSGPVKADMWRLLAELCAATVPAAGLAGMSGSGPSARGQKRKNDDEGGDDDGQKSRAQKRKKMFS